MLEFQERPRPEYAAKACDLRENPITGTKEPFFDPREQLPRILTGMGVIVIMVRNIMVVFIVIIWL